MGELPDAVRYLSTSRGRLRGGKRTRNDDRFRHTTPGEEISGRGWRVAGVGDVQVDVVPRRERRWGAGVTKKCYNKKLLPMEGQ